MKTKWSLHAFDRFDTDSGSHEGEIIFEDQSSPDGIFEKMFELGFDKHIFGVIRNIGGIRDSIIIDHYERFGKMN